MEGGRVLRIPRNVKFTAVCGNKGILSPKLLCRKAEVKLSEDVQEGTRAELCALLDESGSRRNFIGQKIEIFQQLMADASTFHAKEETDQL